MWDKWWPMVIILVSNTVYNICTKSMPEKVNPFFALTITYIVGALLSFILFFITSESKNIFEDISYINWVPFVLGFSVVGLELGYVYLYRAGWEVSIGSLTANILLAIVLLFIGVLFYKEVISLKQIIGILACFIGLFLINK